MRLGAGKRAPNRALQFQQGLLPPRSSRAMVRQFGGYNQRLTAQDAEISQSALSKTFHSRQPELYPIQKSIL